MRPNYFWINGDFVQQSDVDLDFRRTEQIEEGLVFEDIRCYDTEAGPAVFRLEEHLTQFLTAIRELGYSVSYPVQELCDTVHRTMAYNGVREGRVRPAVYPLEGGDSSTRTVTLAVAAWKPIPHSERKEDGVRQAESLELDSEALERVALFTVQDNRILTPPSHMHGNRVMRDTVVILAQDLGYEVIERSLDREELARAEEIFITRAVGDIQPMELVETRWFQPGVAGPVTGALRQAFEETARGRGRRSTEWLDWVGSSFVGP